MELLTALAVSVILIICSVYILSEILKKGG